MFASFGRGNRTRQIVITILAVVTLPMVFVYTSYAIQNKPVPEVLQDTVVIPQVKAVKIKADNFTSQIVVNGEASPQFELVLSAEVSGRVSHLFDSLQAGQLVNSGTALVQIEVDYYLQQMAAAKQSLSEAELELLKEQHESRRAKQDWQRSELSNQKASQLVLREPQLAATLAKVEQAKSSLKLAERNFKRTQINAPFNAIVVKRHVSPGQFVNAGDPIATLYSSDRVDVRVSVPLKDWQLLPDYQQLMKLDKVTLTSRNGESWKGKVTKIENHLDKTSRQRSLTVSVENPLSYNSPLLAGTFLRVAIPGREQVNLLAVPPSSVTSEGLLWYIDRSNRLQSFKAEVAFQHSGVVYIKALNHFNSIDNAVQLLIKPTQANVVGQQVAVKLVANPALQTAMLLSTQSQKVGDS